MYAGILPWHRPLWLSPPVIIMQGYHHGACSTEGRVLFILSKVLDGQVTWIESVHEAALWICSSTCHELYLAHFRSITGIQYRGVELHWDGRAHSKLSLTQTIPLDWLCNCTREFKERRGKEGGGGAEHVFQPKWTLEWFSNLSRMHFCILRLSFSTRRITCQEQASEKEKERVRVYCI